jgi:uncharacterized protein YndB with AHSA1/START domain
MDYGSAFGADFREVQERTRDGQPVRTVIASRSYTTDPADLWSAITDAERFPRWFAPVSGQLELGGRYQIEGNAGGSILKCEPPSELEISWEFGGQVSWVRVLLAEEADKTRMTVEHLIPKDETAEGHWKQFGPGAAGVGWDLTLFGLALHLDSGGEAIDQEKNHAWMASDAGKAFMRSSAESWGKAHVAFGEKPAVAEGMAEQTASFYTGS